MKLETLQHVKDSLLDGPRSFEDCIAWARKKFADMFSNQILQLLHNLPLDKVTAEGTMFWSGAKKPPSPLLFDITDATHMEFIKSAANLRATIYGIPNSWEDSFFLSVLPRIHVTGFQPQEGVKIPTSDEESKSNALASSIGDDVDAQCASIIR